MSTLSTRTTVPIHGTYSRAAVLLDFPSDLAVRYAQQWHLRAGRLKVPASGVVRRALAVYMGHLEHPDTDHGAESRALRNCCTASAADGADQQRALSRLQAATEGADPLPSFYVIRSGPEALARHEAVNARVEALVQQVMGERAQRMRDGKKRKAMERSQAQHGGGQ